MAEIQRRERRCHFRWSTVWADASWSPNRRRNLDLDLLDDALRFSRLDRNCNRIAVYYFDHDVARSNSRESAILFLDLSRRGRDLAASFKSFPADARQRTTFYSEVKIERTAIVGAGSWGTALAWLWGKDGRPVFLWGHNADRKLRDCAGANLIVFVTPSTAFREIAIRLRKVMANERTVFLSCTKGIEHGTGKRMSQILNEVFPEHRIAVLSGPNLAVEVTQNVPTATVIGCNDVDCATSLQRILGSPRFRIYTSQEVTSIELGGALKNVFALAAGISDGLKLGDNSKAALVTRSLAELVRLGVAMGGNVHAFYGLSGAGDLIVTCYSERSRNYTVGKRLGRGEPLAQITPHMKMVAEGIPTARSARECARRLKIATPIIDQVYAVLYEQKKPTVALEELLSREQKAEQL